MHASTLSPRAPPVRLSIPFVPLALVSTRHAAGPGSSSSGANRPAPRPAKLGAALGKNKMGRGEVTVLEFYTSLEGVLGAGFTFKLTKELARVLPDREKRMQLLALRQAAREKAAAQAAPAPAAAPAAPEL